MPFFEGSIVQVSSVGNSATVVWDPSNASKTAFGSLGAVPSGAVLNSVGIANNGTATIWVGGASVTTTTGLPVPAGGQIGIRRYSFSGGVTVGAFNGTISAITAGPTCIVQAGLDTNVTVY